LSLLFNPLGEPLHTPIYDVLRPVSPRFEIPLRRIYTRNGLALREKPGVAVLDVSLPIMNGVTLTRRLRQECPTTRVLLFTMHDDDETSVAVWPPAREATS